MYRFSKRRIIFSRGYFLRAHCFQIKLRRLLSLVVHFSIALKPRTNGTVLKLKPLANSQQKCTAALKVIRFSIEKGFHLRFNNIPIWRVLDALQDLVLGCYRMKNVLTSVTNSVLNY